MAEPMPDLPQTVKVYGYVLTPSKAPISGAKVVYSIVNRPKEFSGIAIDKTYFTTYTNEQGYFEISFIPELLVKIVIPSTGRSVTGVVPLSGPVEFNDLSVY